MRSSAVAPMHSSTTSVFRHDPYTKKLGYRVFGALENHSTGHQHCDLASKSLEALACPATLERRDFVAALRDRPEPVDVAWISLSLHHLLAPAKLSLMREIRNVVGDRGLFLIYENAAPDGEDRDAHLLRWERHYQLCTTLTPQEYEGMHAHVRAYDFPERVPAVIHWATTPGSTKRENCSSRRRTFTGCTVFRHKHEPRVIRYDAALARGKKACLARGVWVNS